MSTYSDSVKSLTMLRCPHFLFDNCFDENGPNNNSIDDTIPILELLIELNHDYVTCRKEFPISNQAMLTSAPSLLVVLLKLTFAASLN
jgi:hypothetical protein